MFVEKIVDNIKRNLEKAWHDNRSIQPTIFHVRSEEDVNVVPIPTSRIPAIDDILKRALQVEGDMIFVSHAKGKEQTTNNPEGYHLIIQVFIKEPETSYIWYIEAPETKLDGVVPPLGERWKLENNHVPLFRADGNSNPSMN
jgi:hypothetical protein